jgi:hypothetical protein
MRTAGAKDVTYCRLLLLRENKKKRKEKERQELGLGPTSLFTEDLGLSLPRIYTSGVFTSHPGIRDYLRVEQSRTRSWALRSGMTREQAHRRN